MNCPFCNHSVNERKYLETKASMAIIAMHALNPGQSLVLPQRHVTNLSELTEHEFTDLSLCLKYAVDKLRKVFLFSSFNIVLNNGDLAGQTMEHLHFHIIPRKVGDIEIPKYWLNSELFQKLRMNSRQEMLEQCDLIKNNG